MLAIRCFAVGLVAIAFTAAPTSRAGVQLYKGFMQHDSFGNDIATPTDGAIGPIQAESVNFQAFAVPQGILCNAVAPKCAYGSTPIGVAPGNVNQVRDFDPLAGGYPYGQCTPYSVFQYLFTSAWGGMTPGGALVRAGEVGRPMKNATPTRNYGAGQYAPIPPLYRNAFFFTKATKAGAPKTTHCLGQGSTTAGGFFHTPGSTTDASHGVADDWTGPSPYFGFAAQPVGCAQTPIARATCGILAVDDPRRGRVMKGKPMAGVGAASTTAPQGAFTVAAADPPGTVNSPMAGLGMRQTAVGEFVNYFPYLYSYFYTAFANDYGNFKVGGGFFKPGATANTVTIPYTDDRRGGGGPQVGRVVARKGPPEARRQGFGGTMKLLGNMTTKVCFFTIGQCLLGENDWQYHYVGGPEGYTNNSPAGTGTVTEGKGYNYVATYYLTVGQQPSFVTADARRFPWTTGTVTLTAVGRGPHRTVHKRSGFDNRTPVSGKGTIQLVTPILTRWLSPSEAIADFETGGIGILRLRFVPEPATWLMLVAGVSLLGVLSRIRGR